MKSSIRWEIAQFFEIRWWKNYFKKKDKLKYYEYKIKYWKRFLSSLPDEVTVLPESRILDAGCGPAGIFIAFPENHITAVDPLLNEYKQKLDFFSPGDFPNVDFFPYPIEEFKSNEKFDISFCLNAINHVNDIQKVLSNLIKLTKPGGKIIISVDTHKNKFTAKIFEILNWDILHPYQFTEKEYYELFAKQVEIQKVYSYLFKKNKIFNYYVYILAVKEYRVND